VRRGQADGLATVAMCWLPGSCWPWSKAGACGVRVRSGARRWVERGGVSIAGEARSEWSGRSANAQFEKNMAVASECRWSEVEDRRK
jgi:hypothetical protein